MLTVAEVRARGIALPSDDVVAQDVIDEVEAWLASRVGPLGGSRTETFLAPPSSATLRLRRPADAVEVTDAGDATDVHLQRDLYLVRQSGYWSGPVLVTYTPTDDVLLRGVVADLLRLGVAETGYESETMGSYSYSRPREGTMAARWSVLRRILPRQTFDAVVIRSRFDRPFADLVVGSDAVA